MSTTSQPMPATGRDHRVDFYRGIALAMIFVNHIPGTVWENYTSRNFGFSDAAEIFVFLAGFASAFAYAKPFLTGSRLVASIKAWRRAGVLYLVHVTLTMIAIGLFGWAALAFGQGGMLRQFGLEMYMDQPIETLVGTVTLGHQLGYVNILPMYAVILLMLPVMLLIVQVFGRLGLLVASIAFWIATSVFTINVPIYPYEGGWFFNPFAWQLLFAIGLYCGLSKWQRGYSVPFNAYVYAAALAYLLFAFLFVRFDAWGAEEMLGLPFLIAEFDKTFVTVPRLLHVLALIYVFAHAPTSSPLARISRGNPFAMLGRHSLPVFAVGTTLSLVCQVIRFDQPASLARDTIIILAGLGLQFALAAYIDWWRGAQADVARRKMEKAVGQPTPPTAAMMRP